MIFFRETPNIGMKFEKFCKLYAKYVNDLHRFRLLEYFPMIQYGEALLRMVG